MRQLEISFEAGILQRFPEFQDAIKSSAYSCGRPFKSVAADLDMSPSELSRKLADNPNDPVHLPAKRLPDLMAATGDLTPIYWLIETFLESPEAKAKRVRSELGAMLPKLIALLEQEGA